MRRTLWQILYFERDERREAYFYTLTGSSPETLTYQILNHMSKKAISELEIFAESFSLSTGATTRVQSITGVKILPSLAFEIIHSKVS